MRVVSSFLLLATVMGLWSTLSVPTATIGRPRTTLAPVRTACSSIRALSISRITATTTTETLYALFALPGRKARNKYLQSRYIYIGFVFFWSCACRNVRVSGEIVGLPYYSSSVFCFYNTFFDNPKESVAKKGL